VTECDSGREKLKLLSSLDESNIDESRDETIKFLAKKQRSDLKSWGRGCHDGHYFYLSRFDRIGNFHVDMFVLPLQGLFQPIYTILLKDNVEMANC
jgi:hypothetical protein